MELAKNQEHTVTIEGYGEGGMGVARIDGRVVFVHGALRGEKCRVLILKTLKSVAFAKVLEVIELSDERGNLRGECDQRGADRLGQNLRRLFCAEIED